jgi:hypothetical protein
MVHLLSVCAIITKSVLNVNKKRFSDEIYRFNLY